ncbi:lectin BRA-3-like [Archocentrus centrarchus]|uniref:lectin BRA-3-like n=1 Tax=Archocentrus centrarchus TaxID=63155 RepID=UPI0011E9E828|nr:lectin BRA-3-like [Archocentrus centrarchus]
MKKTAFMMMIMSDSSGFIFVNVSKTWDDAQSYCRKYHTDLASVRNQFVNEKLRKMMVDSFTWIGLYRNSWKWSDGSAYSFTSWAPNNPSLPVTASCGTIFGGKWFNVDCSQYWYFVCYTVVKQRNMLKVELKKTDTSADMNELHESILEKVQSETYGAGPEWRC